METTTDSEGDGARDTSERMWSSAPRRGRQKQENLQTACKYDAYDTDAEYMGQ